MKIIEISIKNGYQLSNGTPELIKHSDETVRVLIELYNNKNITSQKLDEQLRILQQISLTHLQLENLLNASYILTENSHQCFKQSQYLADILIEKYIINPTSDNYIQLNYLSDNIEITSARAHALINAGYRLTKGSPACFNNNVFMANTLIEQYFQGLITEAEFDDQFNILNDNLKKDYFKLVDNLKKIGLDRTNNKEQENDELKKKARYNLRKILSINPMPRERFIEIYEILLRWEYPLKNILDTTIFDQLEDLFNMNHYNIQN